jgi:hypothetical protein
MVVALAGTGRADAERDVHAGLNYRTDLGTHHTRIELGGRWNRWEGWVVLDPNAGTDNQADHDLVAAYWIVPARYAAFAGWRNTAYALIGELVWHQKLIAGALARLPSLGTDRVRLVAGLEVAAEVVRHGQPIETEWFDASSMRAASDLINFSLFARAEIALGF